MKAASAQEFKAAMQAAGLIPPGTVIADGKIHRCPVRGHSGKQDGAYRLDSDGVAVGGFKNWTDGTEWQDWQEGSGRTLTPAEEEAVKKKLEAQRKQREAEEEKRRSVAADRATKVWDGSTPCRKHPYLARKGVQSHGLRVSAHGNLVIPLYTSSGKLASYQTITPSGAKRFLKDGRKHGCFYILGKITGGTIYIAEGFATGASIHEAMRCGVVVAFDCGNLLPVAQAVREKHPEADLVICADDDYLTEGNPGRAKARAAALAVKGRMVLPDFGPDRPEGSTDFNDMAKALGLDAVRLCIEQAPAEVEAETIDEAVKRLSTLAPFEYDQVRKSEAAALGVRIRTLDAEIKQGRVTQPMQGSGHAVTFPAIEAWDEPVNAAALLEEILATIRSFIVCDSDTAVAASLWIAFTWFIDRVEVAPIAFIVSPERRCGKTQMLDLFSRLAYRPLVASNISPAAVFRVIEAHSPTLLIDEADSFLKENEPMRGVLNSGHTRQSASTIRLEAVGDSFEPRKFSTWGAKALASIGHLAGTIMDRSIVLPLRRKLPKEHVQRLRHADPDHFSTLVRKLARLVEGHGQDIAQARPVLPEKLNDRAQDCWEPLLALADLAGGRWPRLARTAALGLSGAAQEAMSTATELLADIKEAFSQMEKISTDELLRKLVRDEMKPWATYAHGKPMNARHLAKRLREFEIQSQDLKFKGNVVQKGYRLDQFKDPFNRYLNSLAEGVGSATALPTSINANLEVAAEVAVAAESATRSRKFVHKPASKRRTRR